MNFIELLKKFWSSVGAVPTIAVLIYITGFLILNTYLASFGITETNVISYNSVKASIIFLSFNSLLFSLAIFSANAQNTQNANTSSNNNVIIDILISSLIGVLYGIVLHSIEVVYKMKSHYLFSAKEALLIKYIVFSFISILIAAVLLGYRPNMNKFFTFILSTVIVICVSWSIYYGPNVIGTTALYCVIVCFISIIIFKKILNPSTASISGAMEFATAAIGFIFISCILFAYLIYSEVPTQLGGGRPSYLTMYFKDAEVKEMIDSKVISSKEILSKPVKLIYVSDKRYYILIEGKIVGVDIDNVKAVIRN